PDLRAVAGLRRAHGQADAALGEQGQAVDAFLIDFDDEGLLVAVVVGARVLGPTAAVAGVPQFDGRHPAGADVLHFVVERDALTVDEPSFFARSRSGSRIVLLSPGVATARIVDGIAGQADAGARFADVAGAVAGPQTHLDHAVALRVPEIFLGAAM